MEIKNKEDVKNRLLSFIDDNLTDNECWEFNGSLRNGYGAFSVNGNAKGAHRVSYYLHNGELPEDMNVCHKCDNRRCINPKHLFLGSQSDNIKDAVEKGRVKVPVGYTFENGHNPTNSTISPEKAKVIKVAINNRDNISLKTIANAFNVKYQLIKDISAGRSYINV